MLELVPSSFLSLKGIRGGTSYKVNGPWGNQEWQSRELLRTIGVVENCLELEFPSQEALLPEASAQLSEEP